MKPFLSGSFTKGFSKALDMLGYIQQEPEAPSGWCKDCIALKEDWEKVGEGIRKAADRYTAESIRR